MPRTPDRAPGPLIEDEELRFETPGGAAPTVNGGMVYDPTSGNFKMQDSAGVFDPRTGGTGITAATHRPLDQLVHKIAEDNHTEVTRVAGVVTNVTVWTDGGMTVKIRESQITRAAGQVTQVVEIQYDGAGAAIAGETKTTTITRTAGKVTDIDEVMS